MPVVFLPMKRFLSCPKNTADPYSSFLPLTVSVFLQKRMKYVYDPRNPHEERTGTISRVKWLRKNEFPPNYQRPVHYVYTVVECYPVYSLLLASGLLGPDAAAWARLRSG